MPSENQTLRQLVLYSKWASQKLLAYASTVPDEDVVRAIPNSHGGILKTFQHIYYAERLWLARFEKAPVTPFEDPEPSQSLVPLAETWWPLLDRMADFAQTCDPDAMLTFKRLNGDQLSMPQGPLVRHVVNHGTYHRGQVASMLKQSGHAPPSTDLLFYYLEQPDA